jgi:hypothetical protein
MLSAQTIIDSPELQEIARLAVENMLVELRESRISVMRNNGLTIKEYDGRPSDIIRMGFEQALVVGLRAIIESQG